MDDYIMMVTWFEDGVGWVGVGAWEGRQEMDGDGVYT
jgi:hypothetical protein